MPSVLKDRNPGFIFGATFAIGILLLVGAELVVSVFSSGISDEQRASQAVYTAFGLYQEDCDALASTPTDVLVWVAAPYHHLLFEWQERPDPLLRLLRPTTRKC